MNVFTIPLEPDGPGKEKTTALIHDLANLVGAAVTIKDQLCVTTNSTRLSLILGQLACDDPDKPLVLDRESNGKNGDRKRRTRRKSPALLADSQGDKEQSLHSR